MSDSSSSSSSSGGGGGGGRNCSKGRDKRSAKRRTEGGNGSALVNKADDWGPEFKLPDPFETRPEWHLHAMDGMPRVCSHEDWQLATPPHRKWSCGSCERTFISNVAKFHCPACTLEICMRCWADYLVLMLRIPDT